MHTELVVNLHPEAIAAQSSGDLNRGSPSALGHPVSSLRSATARSTSATGDRAGHSFRLPRASLYKRGLDGATPSSCCIAYSNNHDIIVAKDNGTLRAIGLHASTPL